MDLLRLFQNNDYIWGAIRRKAGSGLSQYLNVRNLNPAAITTFARMSAYA